MPTAPTNHENGAKTPSLGSRLLNDGVENAVAEILEMTTRWPWSQPAATAATAGAADVKTNKEDAAAVDQVAAKVAKVDQVAARAAAAAKENTMNRRIAHLIWT